jgi:hypothetical protein
LSGFLTCCRLQSDLEVEVAKELILDVGVVFEEREEGVCENGV